MKDFNHDCIQEEYEDVVENTISSSFDQTLFVSTITQPEADVATSITYDNGIMVFPTPNPSLQPSSNPTSNPNRFSNSDSKSSSSNSDIVIVLSVIGSLIVVFLGLIFGFMVWKECKKNQNSPQQNANQIGLAKVNSGSIIQTPGTDVNEVTKPTQTEKTMPTKSLIEKEQKKQERGENVENSQNVEEMYDKKHERPTVEGNDPVLNEPTTKGNAFELLNDPKTVNENTTKPQKEQELSKEEENDDMYQTTTTGGTNFDSIVE